MNRFGKAFVHITRTAAQRPCLFYLIGERERANLVVLLFSNMYIFPHFTILRHTVTVNRSNFTYTVSRACANIPAGLRVVGGT